MYTREQTRRIVVGGIPIGGGSPVTVQSMTNTDTRRVDDTVAQIRQLADAGCDVVRIAVRDDEAAAVLADIRAQSPVPLVADIHFDHRLALKALEAGIDKLRINPGNIGAPTRVLEVAEAAKARGVPIRIGVNAGSLKKEILNRHGRPTPQALVESALEEVDILDEMDFHDICVSLKSSNVPETIEAYRLFAQQRDIPLHVGITESGTLSYGTVKSSCGIGAILALGIGDTIRVSLTADPVAEVRCGFQILRAMTLRSSGPEIISCPTCGRTDIDIISLAEEVEARAQSLTLPLVIAVMGCVVNGPGEAREADYGIAGGKGFGLLFKNGEVVAKIPESELIDALFDMISADHSAP